MISFEVDESFSIIDERINSLFTEIDNLGNYTNSDWFQSLSHLQYIRLYRTLYDIWLIRGQLSYQLKRSICPFHDPFEGIFPRRFYHETMNTEQIKKACLIVIENLIYSGINGFLDDLEVSQVQPFCSGLLTYLKSSKPAYGDAIKSTKKFESSTEEILKEAIATTKETIKLSA